MDNSGLLDHAELAAVIQNYYKVTPNHRNFPKAISQ